MERAHWKRKAIKRGEAPSGKYIAMPSIPGFGSFQFIGYNKLKEGKELGGIIGSIIMWALEFFGLSLIALLWVFETTSMPFSLPVMMLFLYLIWLAIFSIVYKSSVLTAKVKEGGEPEIREAEGSGIKGIEKSGAGEEVVEDPNEYCKKIAEKTGGEAEIGRMGNKIKFKSKDYKMTAKIYPGSGGTMALDSLILKSNKKLSEEKFKQKKREMMRRDKEKREKEASVPDKELTKAKYFKFGGLMSDKITYHVPRKHPSERETLSEDNLRKRKEVMEELYQASLK